MMAGPLSGVRVLDFTRLLPGPFGTMVLADLGAEVVRVEAPNLPDLLLAMPPMDGQVSAAWRMINRGKRSISVDLKSPDGQDLIKRLVRDFDVVIEQFRPGVMKRLGVDYESLCQGRPDLIYCSITGYGQTGPYRDRAGHDINYLSLSGMMSFTGRKDTGPVLPGIQIADQCAGGLNAALAVIAALYHREKSGRGQQIDISMTDGAIHLIAIYAMAYLHGGGEARREETFLNGGGYYDFYETKDGEYMSVGSLEPQFLKALLQALRREDLHKASPLAENFKSELKAEFKKKTRREWEEVFAKTDACVEPVISIAEMTEHPLALERGMVTEVPTAKGGAQKQIGSPYKMSSTPPEYRFAGEPPGTHTDEVLKEAGFSPAEIEKLRREGVIK